MEKHSDLFWELASIVGPENVNEDYVERLCYSRDSSPEAIRLPRAIVRPGNTQETSYLLRLANRRRFSIVPRGAGTCVGGGAVSLQGDGVVLDLTRMNKIEEISDKNMTVTVEPGITWGELNHELKKKGWRLPFFMPESGFSGTVGGAISSASMSSQGASIAGCTADEVVTLEVVLPNGDVIRTGSDSLPDAGRFAKICNGGDLTGIFLGSMGIFGVITEATLRLEPLPKASLYGAYLFDKWDQGLKFAYNIQKYQIAESLNMKPGKRQVKASFGVEKDLGAKVVIEENDEKIAQRKLEIADDFAKEAGGQKISGYEPKLEEWWEMAAERLVGTAHQLKSMWGHCCHRIPLWKLPQALSIAEEYFFGKWRIDEDPKLHVTYGTYATDRAPAISFYPMLFYDASDPETRMKAYRIWDGWLETAVSAYSACPYWMGYAWARHLMPRLRSTYYMFMVKLKRALDPNNILNPGLLLGGY